MRKLYDAFFHIPKSIKISEKAILMRLSMVVAVIVACLASLGFAAYAYFSCNITSEVNIIKTANFQTNVSISITDTNNEAVEVITSNYQSHLATLDADTTYKVTLKPAANSTAKTGFVIVTAENCSNRYHTQQLGKDGSTTVKEITFYIKTNATRKVTFFAHWGTSTHYDEYKSKGDHQELYITDGETVELDIIGAPIADETLPATIPPATEPPPAATPVEATPATESIQPSVSATEPATVQPTESLATEPTEADTTNPSQVEITTEEPSISSTTYTE